MAQRKDESDWTEERVNRFWRYYASRSDLHEAYFSNQLREGLTRFLDRAGLLRGDVLDFGCGRGFLASEMLKHDVTCWGVDGSAEAVAGAESYLRGRPGWRGAGLASDAHADYRKRRFDLISCIETVEHVPTGYRHNLLTELHSLLKPGGHLFVTTPNAENLDRSMVYCPFCDAEFHGVQHLTAFDAKTLTSELQAAGMTVLFAAGVDFAELQAPLVPTLLDVNARSLMRSTRRVAYEAFDRLKGNRFPSRFLKVPKGSRFPHLAAVAQRPSKP